LPDGTVIWTLPDGHTYVTTPGSALLYPAPCVPTGDVLPPEPERADRRGDPTVMMPQRKTTRAQNRARYIDAERRYNQQIRHNQQIKHARLAAALAQRRDNGSYISRAPRANLDEDPPPF
jgi:hypothetical protein